MKHSMLWVRYWARRRRPGRAMLHALLIVVPSLLIAVLLVPPLQDVLGRIGFATPQTTRWVVTGAVCLDADCREGSSATVHVGGYSAQTDKEGEYSIRFPSQRLEDTLLVCVAGNRAGIVHLDLIHDPLTQVRCIADQELP